MKKALFSLLLTIACLPMAFGQQPAGVHVESNDVVACGSYTWINGTVFTSDTIVTLLRNDTLYVLDLTVEAPRVDTTNIITANGGCFVEWNNKTWETAGIYIDTVRMAGQCDSVVKVEIVLSGQDTIETINETVCDRYFAPWGDTLTQSVDATDTTIITAGCNMFVSDFLLVVNTSDTLATEEIASVEGCSLEWNGMEVTVADSVYYFTRTGEDGCNEVVSVKVSSFTGSTYDTTYVTGCDYYLHDDDTIRNNTFVTDVDTTGDCPAYHTLAITIYNHHRDTASTPVRDVTGGCSLTWLGRTFGAEAIDSTIYGMGTTRVGGCDSLMAIKITGFDNNDHDTIEMEYCGRYIWRHGTTRDTITTDGEYTYTETADGCTTTTHLIISFYENYDTINVGTVCHHYNYTFFARSGVAAAYDEAYFTTSGLHTTDENDSLLYSTDNATRCVTYHAVNVTIREPEQRLNSIDIDTVVCDELRFSFNNTEQVWNFSADSNLYDFRFTTRSCYEVYGHVKVTVNKRDTVHYNVKACDSYTWNGFTNQTYTRSTTDNVVLPDTTNANGCRIVGMLNLTINRTPVVTIEGDWNLYTDSVNSTTLTAVSDMPIRTYKWYKDNQLQSASGNTLTVENVNKNIDIRLESESNEGCTTTNWITVTYTVGIDENEAVSVNLYPNPASRYLNVESAEGLKSIVIYNAIGQQVMMSNVDGSRTTLDLGSLASGNYTMRITAANGEQTTRKFIVNK